MEYSRFAALFEKVKEQKMSPREAALTLKEHLSSQPAARPAQIDDAQITSYGKTFHYDDPYLRDHLVDGERVLIGVTYASLAIDYYFGSHPQSDGVHLRGLEFVRPVLVKQAQPARVRIDARQIDAELAFKAVKVSAAEVAEDVVASGKLRESKFTPKEVDLAGLKASLEQYGDLDEIYAPNGGLELGDSFKTVTQLCAGDSQALARVVLQPDTLQSTHDYLLHPLLISSAFLAMMPLLSHHYQNDLFLPFGIRNIYSGRPANPKTCWLLINLVKKTEELVLFDFDLIGDDSMTIARFEGCALKRRRASPTAIGSSAAARKAMHIDATADNWPLMAATPTVPGADGLYSLIQNYVIQKIEKAANARAADLDLGRNIMDMGLESAQLVEVGAIIQKEMDIELYPTLFFEYTNIRELTDYFHNEHRQKFSRLLVQQPAALPAAGDKTVAAAPALPLGGAAIERNPSVQADKPQPKVIGAQEPIAIIGMHGQFAQADNLDQFWLNLCNETNVMREIPEDHWDYRPWFDENVDAPNKTYCKWGSFIDDVDKFDAGFFNISRREAEWIDPQIRLLLQSVYATAEDAGYINRLRGTNTGVFVGACFHDYQYKIDELNLPVNPHLGINNTHTVMANRISYHLDLTGPSITIDTACSSSLFALHQACQALRNGECDLAFVSGANLLLSSIHYRVFSSLRALSPTGRCHSFDASADGYVPGECIASVLLKPLSQAIRDGDRIEAVIRGSAALHGGYTPSLTAPSVSGEQNVILKAWEDAGVDPETITYVEAHGTGTKLGDPIEINALKNAFARFTRKEQFCAVGSAKANIGHTEGAAGIAGILKVILQMKHRQIPPLMGFKRLNPYVKLEQSALRIQHDGAAWDSPAGIPRCSGISSFGVAGAYAHVVLEEYIDNRPAPARSEADQRGPALIVLSAKNDKALNGQVMRLLDFVQQGRLADDQLADAAYTLQLGREAMESRVALLAGSVAELEEKLLKHLQGQPAADLHQGRAKRNDESFKSVSPQDLQDMTTAWITRGECGKLLELWVKGYSLDWEALRGGRPVRFIPLPTYAFARESYWVPESEIKKANAPAASAAPVVAARLHPLLHENTSDLSAQRYRTRLGGDEFFLADHVVRGEKILPGVAYLEMARAAVVHATSRMAVANTPVVLRNIVWTRPIAVGAEARDIYIEFGSGGGDDLAYEVYSLAEEQGERVVYSHGRARLDPSVQPMMQDLAALRARCGERTISPDECYRLISGMGLELGQRLRGIKAIHVGMDCLLAKLQMPAGLADQQEHYTLHPSLMDASLQACACLLLGETDAPKLTLPYALEGLEVLSPCSKPTWAFIRFSEQALAATGVSNLDIDLCDDSGNVCVRLRGISFRLLAKEPRHIAKPAEPAPAESRSEDNAVSRTLLALRNWKEAACGEVRNLPQYSVHKVVLCDLDEALAQSVIAMHGAQRCVRLECRDKGIAEGFQHLAEQVLKEIQDIFHASSGGRALLQVVFAAAPQRQVVHALAALLKTAQMENSRFFGQVIEVDAATGAELLAARIEENGRTFDQQVRYQDGNRLVLASNEVEIGAGEGTVPWKDAGVYLITGGAGDLGLIFAEEIARRTKDARLILTGRSSLNERQQARLEALRALGGSADYRQVDVTDRPAVADLIAGIVAEHGRLNGIIHSAGVLQDQLIQRRNSSELSRVMAPKVQGLVNLDELTRGLPLDFFLMSSSIAAVMGNAGQADYALGNAFMDGYAHYRDALAGAKLRSGKTLSINWPLWKQGGMRPNEAMENLFRETLGLVSMENRAGLDALYSSLSLGAPQVVVLAGRLDQIRSKVLPPRLPAFAQAAAATLPASSSYDAPAMSPSPAVQGTAGADSELLEKTMRMLVQKASGVLKMPAEDIDVKSELDTFGFNSVALTEFTNMLNREFGVELSPTVFYEHSTLQSFGQYLVEQHAANFAAKFRPQGSVAAPMPGRPEATTGIAQPAHSLPQQTQGRFQRPGQSAQRPTENTASTAGDDAVAIIGISGRFPMAADLGKFWSNLLEGKDCISEIPAERWDWQAIYGDPQREENKSNVKWGGFIDGIAEFDPLFFGISPREAAIMDPQQRLLMMHAWCAIEDAGYSAQSLSGSNTAVYVGTTSTGYGELLNRSKVGIEAYSATSMVPSVGPNRMSYFLNFTGPSEPIETACSSALVAIHRGVQVIRDGSCEMALVGGVNTILSPELHMSFNKAGMLSEDGRCKTFSANANGFARGEGVGIMLLKKLSAAEQAGDHIYGVIRATAQNHGGRAKSLTAPNPKAQAELLKQAYSAAGIDPRTVGYIETHGTGTTLGDPIEIDGLKSAFRQLAAAPDGHTSAGYCGLGSVKSNVGHLELAAGVAGVFKVLLQLKHKTLVKTLHCDTINPYIQLKDSPFYVVQENRPWEPPGSVNGVALPRRAGVSSFSFGGANCHVVIEEHLDRRTEPRSGVVDADNPAIVVLSAKNGDRLRDQAQQLLDFLNRAQPADHELGQIAYTLQVGRDAMEARLAMLVVSVADLREKLEPYLKGSGTEGLYHGQITRNNDMLALFAGDDELQEAVGKWLHQRKFAKLLRLWVQGLAIDWAKLYGDVKPRRMALPTYPFARERYWVAKPDSKAIQLESSREQRSPQPAKRFVEKTWQPSTEAISPRHPAAGRKIAILVASETRALAYALGGRLSNSRIIDMADMQSGHGISKEEWKTYDGCIDLLGCGRGRHDAAAQIRFLQELIEHGAKDDLTLLYVTQGLEAHENGATNLSGAARVGLYRMLQAEYRFVRSRHMDVQTHLSDESLAQQIAAEYGMDSRNTEVCYRSGQRFIAGLKENNLWAKPGARLALDSRHALWISGGTRGLGYLCAQHFVKNYGVRKLVLSGRDEIPPRDRWSACRHEDSPLGRKIRSWLALEEQGVELLVLSVCLTDKSAVQSGVEQARSVFGDIGGVIHCAGTISYENAAFVRKSQQELQRVVDPKVAGLDTLFECMEKQPLQFFALFSSVSAVVPSLASGVSDYAMANAYMDYFAQAKRATHPVVSIQWPRWKESGMGGMTGKAYDRTGLLSHTDAEGLEFLDTILANRIGPVVMPATVNPALWDPARLLQTAVDSAEPATGTVIPLSTLPRNSAHAGAAGQLAETGIANEALAAAVEQWLTGFFAEELRIPPQELKADIPFNEYGMESVMLAQVVSKMEHNLTDISLDPSVILEKPTIRQLASHLSREYPQTFAALVRENPAGGSRAVLAPVPQAQETATATDAAVEKREPANTSPHAMTPLVQAAGSATRQAGSVLQKDRIAIIGMSCHFPDAPDLETFWKNLLSKKDSIKEVPRTRWDSNAHYSPGKVQGGKSISKWGAFLDRIEDFDPGYFKIAESLAVQMDPLERQWLEVSAEALADAGYDRGQLWGKKVGVFAGSRTSNYRDKLTSIDKDVVVGLGQNFIAAHLAHIYNFKGPNFVVDAACASSLTAIHLAMQSIRNGESEMALAGGVDILLDESPYVVLSTAQVLSPDGRCKTFDESANGIGLGEGCGVLVLKPLGKAIADGDKIYGVIDGSAINNDGNTMGITTPNPSAQSELIEAAVAAGNIDPATISYVETHGTGTLIGDPIELNALTRVFTANTDRKQFCGVGSVKSNIGHLLSAAGAASIVKVLLSIIHRQLPPTIHCDNPNPRFNFAQSALYPVKVPIAWHGDGSVLRAGVSSFGLGGNNAHVIVSDEGVPEHLRATLAAKGGKVVFNRKRYWPEAEMANSAGDADLEQMLQPAELLTARAEKANQQCSAQDLELLDFFDVQVVSENQDVHLRHERSTA